WRYGFERFQTDVARAGCQFPDDADVQKQVTWWRQAYLNMSGLSDKDDRADLKLLVHADKEAALEKENMEKFAKWADDPAVDQATQTLRRPVAAMLFGKSNLTGSDAKKQDLE